MQPPGVSHRATCFFGGILLAAASLATADGDAPDHRLSFDVAEGLNLNSFLRQGPVAAHLLLRSGEDPRILVAFPAGNSGVGLWFSHSGQRVTWTLRHRMQSVTTRDDRGRLLQGIVAEADAAGADLTIKLAVLSSVRVLRDFQSLGVVPNELATAPVYGAKTVTWARDRLDGAAGYRLSLEVIDGSLQDGRVIAGGDGKIGLRITALCGETPLTPLTGDDLLSRNVDANHSARNVLTFLSYREKFLAGSWRFNTYFGRDTLMSVRLLMPELTPIAVEAGLAAVLRRLSATGEVAHEEDIGEYAVLDHLRAGEPMSDDPVFDYHMIDGTFLLAPVAEAWLLDDPRGRRRAEAFLAKPDGRHRESQRALGSDLVSNLRLVLRSAATFAEEPRAAQLIGLRPGSTTGQWRDSEEGLGRGRFPYDVNAVFVPAALAAASRFYSSGLLDPYLAAPDRDLLARAAGMATIWSAKAGPLFDVQVPNDVARQAIDSYATSLGVSAADARAAIGEGVVRFHALSLDGNARAVPVINSDYGFELLFGRPSATALDQSVLALMRPFPAGLRTDIGILVANPVFAAADVQARFTKNAYHGTVIWSWQQAVLAAGLERQMRRRDLPTATLARLRGAQRQLWQAIDAGKAVRNSELWSWSYQQGHYRIAPFGVSQADADESNAAQLWSTVYLAIPEPGVRR